MKKLVYILFLLAGYSNIYSQEVTQGTRDPWLWPFSQNSIWNKPIGSNAVYVDANLEPVNWVDWDTQHILELDSDDPVREVLGSETWGQGRCDGTRSLGFTLQVPDDWIVPDAKGNTTPNNNFAFRLPDSDVVFEGCMVSRCTEAGPVHMPSWMSSESNRWYQSIYGDGLDGGGQGASGMSALGGTIRVGEFSSDDPIRHAIKINMNAGKYCYYSNALPGYKWPAISADSYASSLYKGTNPNIVMGSLFAIPPDVTSKDLGLQTEIGEKLFFTMQNYGVYLTEDSYGDYFAIITEDGAAQEFYNTYGFSMMSETFIREMNKLMTALSVIANNSPNTIGGGGTPMQPLAPNFSNVKNHYISKTICEGEFIEIGNSVFTETGNYDICFTNQSECDSIVNLDLTVIPNQEIFLTEMISQGESINIGNEVFSKTGVYSVKLINQFGCDSIVNLNLTVTSKQDTYISKSICQGESIKIGNEIFSKTGNYSIKLVNQFGGDSIVNLDLTVNPTYLTTDELTIYENELPYDYHGQLIPIGTISKKLEFTFSSASGCDSTVMLDLTVNLANETNLVDSVIKINLGSPSNLRGWNDFEVNKTEISKVKYSNESSSTYNFSIWEGWTFYNRGDVSGNCFPDDVIRNYVYTSDNEIRYFTLSNLNTEKIYDIDILSSKSLAPGGRGAVFFVGELADSVNAKGNTCELVTFKDIIPDNNEIRIGYRKRISDFNGHVNAIIITEKEYSDEVTIPSNDSTKSGGMTNTLPIIMAEYAESVNSGTVNILDASKSFDPDNEELSYNWIAPDGVSLSSTTGSTISYLAPDVAYPTTKSFIIEASDGVGTSHKSINITFTPFKPYVSKLQVSSVEASHFDGNNHPVNMLDNNPNTYWSAKGDNQWISMELETPADISHLKLAFYDMNERQSNFDIYLSQDNQTWEPLYEELESCGFSSDKHLVKFTSYKSSAVYKYVKIVGHGNDVDDNNSISEFEVFGDAVTSTSILDIEQQALKVYPNPATSFFTIELIEGGTISIFDITGKNIFQKYLDEGSHNLTVDFPKGYYVITVQSENNSTFKQKLIIN